MSDNSSDGAAPLLSVDGLVRHFDVSAPFLNRLIERLDRSYVRAVDGIDFDIGRGETFSLVGESGCGKSTVARLIVGLYQPTAGSIRYDGVEIGPVSAAAERKRMQPHMQMIFQDPYASLNPRWRVADIVAEPIRVRSLIKGKAETLNRVGELLSQVGLSPADGERFPHEFSGGQRQRIGIARALALNPSVIIGDEPVSALDVSIQAQVINLLMDLQAELNLSYLFIAHDLAVVEHISHRIAVMYLGKIVEYTDKKTLFTNPQHPYTEALLSAVPVPDPTIKRKKTILQGDVPSPIKPPPGCHFHTRCPYAEERCKVEVPQLKHQ